MAGGKFSRPLLFSMSMRREKKVAKKPFLMFSI
jgi:hypothetical protein